MGQPAKGTKAMKEKAAKEKAKAKTDKKSQKQEEEDSQAAPAQTAVMPYKQGKSTVKAKDDSIIKPHAVLGILDPEILKRFCGHMNYHGNVKGDKDARKIMEDYTSGTPSAKRDILAKFSKNGKDLKWIRSMHESTTDTTTTEVGFIEDWYLRICLLRDLLSRRSLSKHTQEPDPSPERVGATGLRE
jgi:hypothetical protein